MTEPNPFPLSPEILDIYQPETDSRATEQAQLARQMTLSQASFAQMESNNHQAQLNANLIFAVRDALPASRLTTQLTDRSYQPLYSARRLAVTAEIPACDELRLADIYSSTVAVAQKVTHHGELDGPVRSKVPTPCYVVGRTARQVLVVPTKFQIKQHLGRARRVAEPIIEELFLPQTIFEINLGRRKLQALDQRRYARSITPDRSALAYRDSTNDFVASTSAMVTSGRRAALKQHLTLTPELMDKYNVWHELAALAVRFSVKSTLIDKLSK